MPLRRPALAFVLALFGLNGTAQAQGAAVTTVAPPQDTALTAAAPPGRPPAAAPVLDPCLLRLPEVAPAGPGAADDDSALRLRLAEREATAALTALCTAQTLGKTLPDVRDERLQERLRHAALRLYAAAALYRELVAAPRAVTVTAPALAALALLQHLAGADLDAAHSADRLKREHPRSPHLPFAALIQGSASAALRHSLPPLRPGLDDDAPAIQGESPVHGYALLLVAQEQERAGDPRGAVLSLAAALAFSVAPDRPHPPADAHLGAAAGQLLVAALARGAPRPHEAALLLRAGEDRAAALLNALADAYAAAGQGAAAQGLLREFAEATVDPAAAAPLWLRLGERLLLDPPPGDTAACEAAAAFHKAQRRAALSAPALVNAARDGLARAEARCPPRPLRQAETP